jgi:proline iminopeptidase
VSALVLRGLFVPEAAELRWFFHDARELAPQAWDALAGLAPQVSRHDLLPWLAQVFQHGEPELQAQVALAWRAWEQALAGERAMPPSDLQAVIDRCRVQSHYLAHRCWLGDGALRAAARKLPRVPVHFLHGARDVVCRPDAARALHALVPHSRFQAVPDVGHDPMHPAMVAAMQDTLRSLREEEHA